MTPAPRPPIAARVVRMDNATEPLTREFIYGQQAAYAEMLHLFDAMTHNQGEPDA